MTLMRNPLSRAALRKTAMTAIAGVSLSCVGGDLARPPSGEHAGLAYTAFPMAMASDADDNGKKRGDDTSHTSGRGDDNKRHPHSRADDSPPAGSGNALHIDANRRMVGVSLRVGQDRRDGNHAPHYARGQESWDLHHHVGEHEGGPISEAFLRNIRHDDSHDPNTVHFLDKAVSPVARRYSEGTKSPSLGTSIFAKTKFALGASEHSPNEVLAVGLDPQSIERAKALGFQADDPVGADEVSRLTVPSHLDALHAQDLLNHEFPGQQFELNKIYRIYRAQMRDEAGPSVKSPPPEAKCPEDRCFARAAIGWKDELGSCASAVKVGVIDTAFDLGHPVFAGRNNIHTFDFLADGRKPAPDWHGTGVLSLLAANPSSSVPGLIPDAEFFAASVFFSDDDGEMAADTISVLKALDWMKKNDVKIVNMSFAGPRDELVAQEIDRMAEAGVIFVAAAGNGGPTADPSYPAAYPQVIAVTAVTKELRNYRYANRGLHIDLSAPGVDIWAAVPGGREGYHTGTSFAAPHVTAVLAVEQRDAPVQDKAALLDSMHFRDLSEHGRDEIYGRGLLLAPDSCKPPSSAVASAE
jgi:subtilisin family serine protease